MRERSQKLLLLNSLARSEWECQMVVIQAVNRHAWWLGNLLSSTSAVLEQNRNDTETQK